MGSGEQARGELQFGTRKPHPFAGPYAMGKRCLLNTPHIRNENWDGMTKTDPSLCRRLYIPPSVIAVSVVAVFDSAVFSIVSASFIPFAFSRVGDMLLIVRRRASFARGHKPKGTRPATNERMAGCGPLRQMIRMLCFQLAL